MICSWITATLKWYIGTYTLLPIDFNGKLEIFLKHLKKKIFFVCACVSDWTLIIFQEPNLTSSHVNFVFFKKKKFFCVDFNTNNFEIFSCQHVSAMLNFKFFFLLSHVLTFNFNFNFNMSLPSMNVMWVWILFNLEYAWLNFSFPHSNYFIFIWTYPHSNLI